MAESRRFAGALDAFGVGRLRVVVLSGEFLAALTAAERAVVGLAAVGLSNRAIAERRNASVRTVANQLAGAYRKLGVGSRFELMARLQPPDEGSDA
ncbi:MAG: helix-turn-helix transcriptional regulator [Myxococcales bacterium]|nr:helix-turn-helix transcriptional regulator [Myxococcales bacterium]